MIVRFVVHLHMLKISGLWVTFHVSGFKCKVWGLLFQVVEFQFHSFMYKKRSGLKFKVLSIIFQEFGFGDLVLLLIWFWFLSWYCFYLKALILHLVKVLFLFVRKRSESLLWILILVLFLSLVFILLHSLSLYLPRFLSKF